MIAINKMEKDKIRAEFPDVHIVRTMKQRSKRHHYYVVEEQRIVQFVKQMREGQCMETVTHGE